MARSARVFWIAVVLVAAFRLLVWVTLMRHVPLVGDEDFYFRRSNLVVNWFAGNRETSDAVNRLVARGWFMPGPSFLAAPIRALTDSVGTVRLWMGLLDLTALVITTRLVWNRFGQRLGLGILLIVGLFPDAASQSFTLWGEAIGSKIFLLALLGLLVLVRGWSRSQSVVPARLCGIGLLVGFAVYLRPPLLFQLVTLLGLVVLVGFGRRDRTSPGWVFASMMILVVSAAVLVAPWTAAVSTDSGGFVPTTLTVDVNLIHAFANPEDLEDFAGGTEFGDIHSAVTERAEADDTSYAAALRRTRGELLSEVGLSDYWGRADREVESFLSVNESFLSGYRDLRINRADGETPWIERRFFDGLLLFNKLIWYPLILSVAYAFLRRFPLTDRWGLEVLGAKVALLVFAAQPFLSNAKFRHLGVALPVMALLACLVWSGAGREGQPDELNTVAGDKVEYLPWAVNGSRVVQLVAGLMAVVIGITYLN